MKRLSWMVLCVGLLLPGLLLAQSAPKGGVKSKFYDFSDQLIDGDIKKPTALYTDARQKVKFERLLRLKKSFLDPMMQTAKEEVFR